jgi:hypothetical protein
MASTYITRTMSGGSATTTKFTFSAWVKRTGLSSNDGMQILSVSNEYIYLGFFADTLRMEMHDSDNVRLRSNAVFRDTNAWYHVVFTFDSTQSTASDRMKMWVNNEQITDFSHSTYPSLNYGSYIGGNTQHTLGRRENDDSDYFDGIISHAHLTVGYTYTPSAFGSTDSTTGEWKINTSPSVSYGNNGFFILKDGNSVTDQSGNSNNFTVGGGTLTKTEDCPSNVFSTIDLLSTHASNYTFANGNNKVTNSNGSTRITRGTLGASSGKYYFETKIATVGGSGGFGTGLYVGVTDADYFEQLGTSQAFIGTGPNQVAQRGDGSHLAKNNTQINGYESCSAGNILQVALDLDNGYVYFGVNGTWGNSGDPTSGSSGTGGVSITTGKTYMFAASGYNGWSVETNFGNGYFGTTAVSSAGTNASGNGIFEYDVPTGYTALSTKGLNE